MLADTTPRTPPRADCRRRVPVLSRSPPKRTCLCTKSDSGFLNIYNYAFLWKDLLEKGQMLMAYARTLIFRVCPELNDSLFLFLCVSVSVCARPEAQPLWFASEQVWGLKGTNLNNLVDWLPAGSKTALEILLWDNRSREMDEVGLLHSFIIGSMNRWTRPVSLEKACF